MTSALHAQLSCTVPRKLRRQHGVHAPSSSCNSLVSFSPKRSPLLEGHTNGRQRHCGPAVLITAAMNMQVMVKLSVAKSSGKLDLSNCGLKEVPPEVCDLRDLEVNSCIVPNCKTVASFPGCSHLSS